MPSIAAAANAPAKLLLIGKSGAGKTGSLASLVTEGYNLRIIDTDKGVTPLRTLLTDSHYPYSALIQRRGIDLNTAVRYVPIDTSMRLRTVQHKVGERTTSEAILAPSDARAWPKVINLLERFKDDDLDLGPVADWTTKDVLVADSFSTLAQCAYYFSQALNGRLGARDEGFDYQRDIGAAQSQLRRLLELLYDSSVACNVIVISHITWVDESRGVAARPRTPENNDQIVSTPDGYPSAIGRALSPQMGKYFNDVFVVQQRGSGTSVSRTISTVPQEGVLAKNSVYMEREYSVSSGLAEIFAAIRGSDKPTELVEACKPVRRTIASTSPAIIPAQKPSAPGPAAAKAAS